MDGWMSCLGWWWVCSRKKTPTLQHGDNDKKVCGGGASPGDDKGLLRRGVGKGKNMFLLGHPLYRKEEDSDFKKKKIFAAATAAAAISGSDNN